MQNSFPGFSSHFHCFEQAIHPWLQESIYCLEPMPTTWLEWKHKASLLDNQWRQFQDMQPKAATNWTFLFHPPPAIISTTTAVMVQPPFPFSAHLWLPLTPSASTLLQLRSILAQLMQLHCAHSQTNCGSILDLFGPGSHTKGHHLYTLSTFVLFA